MKYSQTEMAECGLVCLAFASGQLGAHHDLPELRRRFPSSDRGLTLKQLSEIAAALDIHARALKCDVRELTDLQTPTILHWDLNHFVVLVRANARHITVHDPAKGRMVLTMDEVGRHFTGIALELSAAPGFRKRREKSPLSLVSWLRPTANLYGGLAQVLLLSLLLQAYVVASPFYMQLAIDQAALKGDKQLLVTLAIGFTLFGVFNLGATVLRSLAMQQVAAVLSWDMSLRLFRHLVRLPLGWFQRRRLADTISRFDAINPIRDQISGALISSIIDGVLALFTLMMMFLFEIDLAIWTLAGVLVYLVIRLASLPTSMRLGAESLSAHIAESASRIETVKAIQTIKTMGAEIEQEGQWANRYAAVVRQGLKASRFSTTVHATQQGVEVIVGGIVIYVGARAIIAGQITVGILYAFMAYRAQFITTFVNVIEQVIQWRLNDIYSYRLADIVLTPREAGIDDLELRQVALRGDIELDNIAFRYSGIDSFVFKGLNLRIQAGEMIAVVGPSGAGKSTLLKVLSGLYPPTLGEVRIDGRTLASWGPKAVRRALGVVMQDDELLSGSIAENVAFFDEHIDIERVWAALDAACLREEVMAMPMKLETLLGDSGTNFSGGQKQRLFIARALYRQPAILLLDEATSHLDVDNERLIGDNLRRMRVTRIIIAHRPETIRSADRIFDITTGQSFKVIQDAPTIA